MTIESETANSNNYLPYTSSQNDLTFHSRYIDESSGIASNGIWRVAAAKNFKGIF